MWRHSNAMHLARKEENSSWLLSVILTRNMLVRRLRDYTDRPIHDPLDVFGADNIQTIIHI